MEHDNNAHYHRWWKIPRPTLGSVLCHSICKLSHVKSKCLAERPPNNFTVESVCRIRPEGEGKALVPDSEGEAPSSVGADMGVVQDVKGVYEVPCDSPQELTHLRDRRSPAAIRRGPKAGSQFNRKFFV